MSIEMDDRQSCDIAQTARQYRLPGAAGADDQNFFHVRFYGSSRRLVAPETSNSGQSSESAAGRTHAGGGLGLRHGQNARQTRSTGPHRRRAGARQLIAARLGLPPDSLRSLIGDLIERFSSRITRRIAEIFFDPK